MLIQKIFSHCCKSVVSRRFINQSTKSFESKISDTSKVSSTTSASSAEPSVSNSVVGPRMVAPTGFEQWILVWMKKYPKGQVPNRIKEEVLYQSKSRARIKAANYMIAVSVLMCIGAIISGRKARKEGDSIHKRNTEWHRKINEEHKAKLATES